jgi:molybdopterin/thiamine biosynthesis adenylyltransferase
MLAPRVKGVTGLPLIGMTISTDSILSGRFWIKTAPRTYSREWCNNVRIVGKALKVHYCDMLMPRPRLGEAFTRTFSAWGDEKQHVISRLHVGIVGLGSVGSILAESLMKTGVQQVTLIDFDLVERKNLDRLQGIGREYIGQLKVDVIKEILECQSITTTFTAHAIPFSIIEEEGFKHALDCDLIFSAVDRPWARYVLNKLSYANLIPVIDGGIDTNQNRTYTNIDQARWRTHTVCSGRRCLKCLGQYKSEDVALEQSGLLEDPAYIRNLPDEHFIHRGENVYAFSIGLAAMEIQQFLSLILQPRRQYYGPKEFDFNSGTLDSNFPFECDQQCEFLSVIPMGDKVNSSLIARHQIAESARQVAAQLAKKGKRRIKIILSKIFNKIVVI